MLNLQEIIAETSIEEFSEQELQKIEKYGYDGILGQTEICRTVITEEDSQEGEVHSSVKYDSTANSTMKSIDIQHRAQCLEISIPDYLATEKVEEESSLLEAGSALLKDLSTHRESMLSKAVVENSNKGAESSEIRSRATDSRKR